MSIILSFFCIGIVGLIAKLLGKKEQNCLLNNTKKEDQIQERFEIKKQYIINSNPDIKNNKDDILAEINRYNKLN